jgi:hypothetical protein
VYTALAYNAVRNSLLNSPATSVVVVLDCCYSGRALGALRSVQDEAIGKARLHGGFVLTSAAPDELALAPEGDTYTAFTGEFLKPLRDGDPDGPPQMTLQSIYRYLVRVLPARGGPRPRRVMIIVPDFSRTGSGHGTGSAPAVPGRSSSCFAHRTPIGRPRFGYLKARGDRLRGARSASYARIKDSSTSCQ